MQGPVLCQQVNCVTFVFVMSRRKKRSKRNRSTQSTPSPKLKVPKRLNMDVAMENPTTNATMESTKDLENKPDILQEIYMKLNYVTKKVEEIDRKQDQILSRVDRIEKTVAAHDKEIHKLNEEFSTLGTSVAEVKSQVQPKFSPDITLVVTNPPRISGSDYQWAVGLIHALGGRQDMIVDTMRTPERNGKKGIFKIQLRTVEEKINLLRNKSQLKHAKGFERVFVRSSKSHTERIIDINFKTLLSEMPQLKSFRIAGNGRLMKREWGDTQRKQEASPKNIPQQNALTTQSKMPLEAHSAAKSGSSPQSQHHQIQHHSSGISESLSQPLSQSSYQARAPHQNLASMASSEVSSGNAHCTPVFPQYQAVIPGQMQQPPLSAQHVFTTRSKEQNSDMTVQGPSHGTYPYSVVGQTVSQAYNINPENGNSYSWTQLN